VLLPTPPFWFATAMTRVGLLLGFGGVRWRRRRRLEADRPDSEEVAAVGGMASGFLAPVGAGCLAAVFVWGRLGFVTAGP
jgi:hypothetical protein